MAKTVKITTDNTISVVDIPWNRHGWYDAIGGGCDIVETVKSEKLSNLLDVSIVMITDKEGRMRNQDINMVASLLYCPNKRGLPIVGNVIIGVPYGPYACAPADPEAIKRILIERFPILEEDV